MGSVGACSRKVRPVLSIAAQVLSSSTIEHVCRQPFNVYGWRILDRWAYNAPEQLRVLEGKGIVVLLNRLLEQQRREFDVLTSPRDTHLSGMEKLQLHEIQAELA